MIRYVHAITGNAPFRLRRGTVRPWRRPVELQTYWFSGTNISSATDQHQLFLEQMNELHTEQRNLFGSTAEMYDPAIQQQRQQQQQQQQQKQHEHNDELTMRNNTNDSSTASTTDALLLEVRKQNRELNYGFTEQDHTAWSDHGVKLRHDASFMELIARKRQEHFDRLDNPARTTNNEERNAGCDSNRVPHSSSIDKITTPGLSHVSADGTTLHMVDVGSKPLTTRIATAETIVQFPPVVVNALRTSNNTMPKGPVFSTAITAGIMAAKQTSNLIPLCHPLFLSKINVEIEWMECDSAVRVQCQCKIANASTGVEMEALTGSTIAALTIYDMVKAVSHDVVLSQTRLVHKEGGKRHFDIRRK